MSGRRLLLSALAFALAGGTLAAPVAGARKHPRKVVRVGDDYFSPAKLTRAKHVKPGTRVVWHWLAGNTQTHDVKLVKGPKGVHKFHSPSAASDYSFGRTLHKRGVYHLVCTFHPDMKQTIAVRR